MTPLSRRRFGQGLGGSLALALLPRSAPAHDGPHEVEVAIAGFAFAPQRIEVMAGDTVTWLNDDLAPHTATAVDGSWDTGAIENGSAGRIIFETPGEHAYLCAFHPQMTGTVIVRAGQGG